MKKQYTTIEAMHYIRKYNKGRSLVTLNEIQTVLNYLNDERYGLLNIDKYINELFSK